MKEFNLERALAGDPVVTRKGKSAKLIAYVPECDPAYRVVALVEMRGITSAHYADGRISRRSDSDIDLFMAPKKRTVWVNVYGSLLRNENAPGTMAAAFHTEEGARLNARLDGAEVIAAAIPIEIEE